MKVRNLEILIYKLLLLTFLLSLHSNSSVANTSDICKQIKINIENPQFSDILKIENQIQNFDNCKNSSELYFLIGKKYYLLGSYQKAIPYFNVSKQRASLIDDKYAPARYFLIMAYLKYNPSGLNPNDLTEARRANRNDTYERQIRDLLRDVYPIQFGRYKKDPFTIDYPTELIALMDKCKVQYANDLSQIRDITIRINQIRNVVQTATQIPILLDLYLQLKDMNVPVDDEYNRLSLLNLFYLELELAEKDQLPACEHYKNALELEQTYDFVRTEINLYCKKERSCFEDSIYKTFQKYLSSFKQNQSMQNSLILRFNDKMSQVSKVCGSDDLINRIKKNIKAFALFKNVMNNFTFKAFNEFFKNNKHVPIIKLHQPKLADAILWLHINQINHQLSQAKNEDLSVADAQKKLISIQNKMQDMHNKSASSGILNLSKDKHEMEKLRKQTTYLTKVFLSLSKHKGKEALQFKNKIGKALWRAWNIDKRLSHGIRKTIQLKAPEVYAPFSFLRSRLQITPNINIMDPYVCTIFEPDNTCRSKVPIYTDCKVELLIENKALFTLTSISQNTILSQTDQPIIVSVPAKLFIPVTFSHSDQYKFSNESIEICKQSLLINDDLKRLPVIASGSFKNGKLIRYLIPGQYRYNVMFNDDRYVDIWFQKLNLLKLENKNKNILPFNNKMRSQRAANTLFEAYYKKNLKKSEYLCYAKGNKCFFKYFVPWVIQNHTPDNCNRIWNIMVEPIFQGEYHKWYHLFMNEQIKHLGLSINNKTEPTSCDFLKNLLCFILTPEKCTNIDKYLYKKMFSRLNESGFIAADILTKLMDRLYK